MPFSRKTEEEKAAAAAQREQQRLEGQERKRAEAIEKAHAAFLATPAGLARAAFERGDDVFQYSIDVMNQQAIVVAMVGTTTSKKTTDPTDVLNSVCREGWELVNGSFVFVEQGQQSRDKFMSSGQNIAVKGAVVGYYLFKRRDENRQTPLPTPWLDGAEDLEATRPGPKDAPAAAERTPEAAAAGASPTREDDEAVHDRPRPFPPPGSAAAPGPNGTG